jgi:SAM-dependent methyltransferase
MNSKNHEEWATVAFATIQCFEKRFINGYEKEKIILELGSSYGFLCKYFTASDPKTYVTAVESNHQNIIEGISMGNYLFVRWYVHAFEDIDFTPRTFDVVINAFPFFLPPSTMRAFYKKLHWVLKPGARVYSFFCTSVDLHIHIQVARTMRFGVARLLPFQEDKLVPRDRVSPGYSLAVFVKRSLQDND